jgi:hypothetical protein
MNRQASLANVRVLCHRFGARECYLRGELGGKPDFRRED